MRMGELRKYQFTNQYSFFDDYQESSLINIKNDLKNYFESIDQEIFLSSWRKNNGYIPDGFKFRTILTIYGRVTYKRRVYKYWNKTKYNYVFLADKRLQIEKYSRITSHLKFKILQQIATGKRQRDICDMFTFAMITKTTISNIVKSFNFESSLKFFAKDIIKVKVQEYLYINMDETFIKLRKNNKMDKYRVRLVIFHTGYDEIYSTNKRKVLANKRVYYQLLPVSKKINTTKFMTKLERIAKKFYSNVDNIKIIIGGDGAHWIREANSYWANSKYVLDKFHAVRYLRQFFCNKINKEYQNSKNLFNNGEYDNLIIQLNQNAIKWKNEKKFLKIINYFTNNAAGISNQKLKCNIGVSIESDISHIVKWLLGYGSKAFNYQTFKKSIFLKVAEINQFNVINFLKKIITN